MRLEIPYPPSANRYWRHVGRNVVVSSEARKYRERVRWLALSQLGRAKPLEGDVTVAVTVFRPAKRGDLDNCLKVLLDALRGVAYLDDSQVARLHASRYEDRANPRAVVLVEPC